MRARAWFLLPLLVGAGLAPSPRARVRAAGPAAAALQQPPARTPDVHYVPTPSDVVDAMLGIAGVTSTDVIYDLGSGDGRIVITAAQKFGARGVGVELDAELVKEANAKARKAGVAGKVTFIQGDLFTVDLSEATVVTLYLLPSINLRLQPKLLRELRPGSRVVSHRFPMGDWTPDQDLSIHRTHVYLWRVPNK